MISLLCAASRRPIVVDLYAGAGGMSLGMEQAGFDVVAAAEYDPIHALTHSFNFPHTPVICRDLGDGSARQVSDLILDAAFARRLNEGGMDLDAVVGGPPCQGFSAGGVRDASDDRNGQLLRFVDLVIQLQPKVFCLENVAGLLEPRFEPLRKEAIRRLTVDGGYVLGPFGPTVNAADFGVPQNRRRVLLMGSRIGAAPELRPATQRRVTVRQALEGLPDLARYHSLLRSDEVELLHDDLSAMRRVRSAYARRLVGLAKDDTDYSYQREHDIGRLTNSRRTVHAPKSVQRFARTRPGTVERISRLYRLDPEIQARTLRAGTGSDRGSHTSPRPIHPAKNRVITVREAARLHGFPDWFRFHATNWHGHRQVGNSVPPPLAAAAGRALLAAMGTRASERPNEVLSLGEPEWLWYSRAEAEAFFVAEALGH